jgi:hypothetical protein
MPTNHEPNHDTIQRPTDPTSRATYRLWEAAPANHDSQASDADRAIARVVLALEPTRKQMATPDLVGNVFIRGECVSMLQTPTELVAGLAFALTETDVYRAAGTLDYLGLGVIAQELRAIVKAFHAEAKKLGKRKRWTRESVKGEPLALVDRTHDALLGLWLLYAQATGRQSEQPKAEHQQDHPDAAAKNLLGKSVEAVEKQLLARSKRDPFSSYRRLGEVCACSPHTVRKAIERSEKLTKWRDVSERIKGTPASTSDAVDELARESSRDDRSNRVQPDPFLRAHRQRGY